jgi:hypothetical protein
MKMTRVALAFLIVVVPLVARSQDNSPCTAAVIQTKWPGKLCNHETVDLRVNTGMQRANLARVIIGSATNTDVPFPIFNYFLVTHEGVVDLGEFRAWLRQPQSSAVFTQLGYDGAKAGGLMGTDTTLFFDVFLEKRHGEYCLVHSLKAPFMGEFFRCASGTSGKALYGPGTLTWREAGERACKKSAEESGSACEHNRTEVLMNRIIRSELNGRASYEITTRREVRACPELTRRSVGLIEVPVEYEVRKYRMEIDGENERLVETVSQPCR